MSSRLVYLSSIKVNGEQTVAGDCFTSVDKPFTEDPYGISKLRNKLYRISAKTGLEVVIIRAPLIYGAGVKGNFYLFQVAESAHLSL